MNMKKIHKQIAKKNGISVSEVKRDMQAAIDEAYKNPGAEALAVTSKGDVPTPEELIGHIAHKVRVNC